MSIVKCLSLSLLFLLLLMHSTTTAAEYTIPCAAWSVYAGDLDLDGDKDIVVGHNYNSQTEWSGISILDNNGCGEFVLIDSIYLYSWQTNIFAININNDEYPDIIGRNFENDTQFMTILEYSGGIYIHNYYSMEYGISEFITGDIDGDQDIDIVVISNNGFFWGYLLNNGDGVFSLPVYHDLSFPPGGIACGDLNNDMREDIVVCGYKLEAYLSYPDSFQCMLVDVTDYQNDVKIGDIDNDGDNDLVVARYGAPHLPHSLQIYHNDGNCNFTLAYEEAIPIGISDLQLTDLNNDSYLDIIYTKVHGQNYVCVRMNNGDGIFLYEENYNTNLGCIQCFSADLDGNGWNDIITTCVGNNISSVYILFNDTTGNFVEEPQGGIDPPDPHAPDVTLSFYPNPFENQATIEFSIKERGFVELTIYDIKGRLVKEFTKQNMEGGTYNVVWNGKDDHNQQCSSGIYLMNMKLDEISKKAEKIIMLK